MKEGWYVVVSIVPRHPGNVSGERVVYWSDEGSHCPHLPGIVISIIAANHPILIIRKLTVNNCTTRFQSQKYLLAKINTPRLSSKLSANLNHHFCAYGPESRRIVIRHPSSDNLPRKSLVPVTIEKELPSYVTWEGMPSSSMVNFLMAA